MNRGELGGRGEEFACSYMRDSGMKLLARNYRCRAGEIDVIARAGETVVFVEVKTRSGVGFGTAAEAVTRGKQRKLVRAARRYIAEHELEGGGFRFDVAEVYAAGGGMEINYIQNAFEAE
jgi:putative endonuclease